MRDPNRIPNVLKEVERIWQLYPDMRLGQLISNISDWAEESIWDLEEERLVSEIQRHLDQSPRAAEAQLLQHRES